MSYPDRLASLRKIQKRAGTVLTEPTKGASGSSVSTDSGPFQKNLVTDAYLKEAARNADLDPGTLATLLSSDDCNDLAAGTLKSEELKAYARSIVGRWKAGVVLPDERRLNQEYLNDEKRHPPQSRGPNPTGVQHGER